MPVKKPVAGLIVNLHVADPQLPAYLHLCVEEVRTGIAVVQSGVYYLYLSSLRRVETTDGEEPVFPAIVQELFHELSVSKGKDKEKSRTVN